MIQRADNRLLELRSRQAAVRIAAPTKHSVEQLRTLSFRDDVAELAEKVLHVELVDCTALVGLYRLEHLASKLLEHASVGCIDAAAAQDRPDRWRDAGRRPSSELLGSPNLLHAQPQLVLDQLLSQVCILQHLQPRHLIRGQESPVGTLI